MSDWWFLYLVIWVSSFTIMVAGLFNERGSQSVIDFFRFEGNLPYTIYMWIVIIIGSPWFMCAWVRGKV